MTTASTTPLQATPVQDHAYLRTHRIRDDVLRYQLSFEESRLHERAESSAAGRAGKTLVKEGSLRIVQVALQQGMRLPWHEVAGAASIQVLRGRLQMATADGTMDLVPGALVVLDAGVQRSAIAMSDCVILVTLSMHDLVRR